MSPRTIELHDLSSGSWPIIIILIWGSERPIKHCIISIICCKIDPVLDAINDVLLLVSLHSDNSVYNSQDYI